MKLCAGIAVVMVCSASIAMGQTLSENDVNLASEYYADVMLRAQLQGKSPCAVAGEDASTVMIHRYAGFAMSTQMQSAVNGFERSIISDAYSQDRMISETYRTEQIAAFRVHPYKIQIQKMMIAGKPSAGHVYQDLLNRLKRMAYVML